MVLGLRFGVDEVQGSGAGKCAQGGWVKNRLGSMPSLHIVGDKAANILLRLGLKRPGSQDACTK